MIRSHQQKDAGYKLHRWAGSWSDPPCITIFSAPNYCQHGNPASILVTGNESQKARVLVYEECSQKNYFLPDTETGLYPEKPFDVFNYFMPAIGEWMNEIFTSVINKI